MRLLSWLEYKTNLSRWSIIAYFLVLFGAINIMATYTKLSHAFDEAPHVGAGMEWWAKGEYTYEPKHPPIPRILASGLLYAAGNDSVLGLRSSIKEKYHRMWYEGSDILHANDNYKYNLFLARLGTLPFFLITSCIVLYWSRSLFGDKAALISLGMFVTLPALMGHAGMAATDMGHACMLTIGIATTIYWLKLPNIRRTLLLTFILALMVNTKLSCLAHYPTAIAFIVFANYALGAYFRHEKRVFTITPHHFAMIFLCIPIFLVVAGSFIFYSGETFSIGLKDLVSQNKYGHATWLFERLNNKGVWYFFPVVYLFKTPFAFLASNVLVGVRCFRELKCGPKHLERIFPILAALAVFVASMPSNINVGIRHALPVYPLLAIPAGYGILWVWEQKRYARKIPIYIMSFLLLWQVTGFIFSYPDRISYFNLAGKIISGGKPEYISPDSDVDWGQGFLQLAETIKEKNITEIRTCFWLGGSIRDMRKTLGVADRGCKEQTTEGWLAISRVEKMLYPEKYTWLDDYEPIENVGNTILLYKLP